MVQVANDRVASQHPAFQEVLQANFPGSLLMPEFFARTYEALSTYGFDRENTIGMVAICRDEITEALFEAVLQYWGKTFNCCSLSGFVMMGKTGLAAATAHAPICDGVRRFALYAMPHIAISEDGKIGEVYRESIQQVSHACGALSAIAAELNSGHLHLTLDMQDIEQSIIRQKLLGAIHYGDKPDLAEITKLASQVIAEDVRELLGSVDRFIFHYAVMTGIQIHGPQDSHWIYPLDSYVIAATLPEGRQDFILNL